MKNKIKLLLLLIVVSLCSLIIFKNTTQSAALTDYIDEDGNVHAGWSMVGSSMDQKTWYFDSDTGDIGGSLSMSGDMSAGTMTNFAIRNIPLVQDDTYTVSATFLPHDGMNTDYETTYGIVLWYQNSNNYLVYWLQTKGQENKNEDAGITVGAWSGNLYGKVGGKDRYFYVPESYCSKGITYSSGWRGDEFCDMWYDNSMHAHPDLLGKTGALLTAPVTLKATSSVSSALGETCRKFELYEVVNGTEKKCLEMYVRGITGSSGSFYTGVGAKKMNCTISDFTISPTKTNFYSSARTAINAIPSTISTTANVQTVVDARNAYDGLLSLKSNIGSTYVTKLTEGEANCAALFNTKALALDPNNVDEELFLEVYDYYNYSFNDYIRAKISAEALANYQECYRSYGHTCDFGFNFKYDAENHWKECLECGATESEGTHSFDSGKVTIQPTCAVEGTKTYTCISCGYEKKETIAKKSHNYSDEYVGSETHHYYQCACGAKDSEEEHDFNSGIISREPTCTNTGIKTYTCETCGYAKDEVLPVISHDYSGGWSGNSTEHWMTCTICKTEKTEIGEHSWDSGVITKDPTCIDLGVKTYTCSTCNLTKEETVDYVDHAFSTEWTTTDSTYHWHECSVCGERNDNAKHQWDSGVYIVEPQDDVEGIIKYTCTGCGGTREENTGTLNHEHTFSTEWKYDSNYHWHLADCGHYEIADKVEHDWDNGVITTPATCQSAGYMTYTCTVCSGTKRVKIETGDHLYEQDYNFDSSNHWMICSLCGYEDLDNTTKHLFDSGVITTASTCTKQGVKTYTCSCGFEKEESVDVIDHEYVNSWSSDNSFHWHICKNCNAIDYDTRVKHTWDNGVVDEASTCKSTGRLIYTCSVCNANKTEIIALAEHEYKTTYDANATYHYNCCANCNEINYTTRERHSWDSGKVVTQATCFTKGLILYTCEECSHTKTTEIDYANHTYDSNYSFDATSHWYKCLYCDEQKSKGSHYWDNGVEVSASTCSVQGTKKYTCIDCGAVKMDYTPLEEHKDGLQWEYNSDFHWHNCENCNAIGTKTVHKFDEGVITEEATCISSGIKTYTCTDCGFTKTESIEMANHDYDDTYQKDNLNHWHVCSNCHQVDTKDLHYFGEGIIKREATCLNDGIMEFSCVDCGYTKTEKINALGHVYEEELTSDSDFHWHKCERCDSKNAITEHFYGEGVVITAATCLNNGETVYTCIDCSYEKKVITKTSGHIYSDYWLNDKDSHWHICEECEEKTSVANHSWDSGVVRVEPTTSSKGTKVYTCTICGATKSEEIAQIAQSKGCGGSIISSICGVFTLTGALILAKKKRKK